MSQLHVTLLGTGTSTGIPEIGCHCKTCTSLDPRDNRLRASALIEKGGEKVLIDCGPDFRIQMLRAGVEHLSALFVTHEHYDHLGGLDDIRPLLRGEGRCPIYMEPKVIEAVKTRMPYAFGDHPYPGVPHLDLRAITPGDRLEVAPGFVVEPIRVLHGRLPIVGFMVDDFVYITDAKTLPDETYERIAGKTKTLVINALRLYEHPAHFALSEALEAIRKIAPTGETYLTHFAHTFGTHREIEEMLPPHVHPGYDGLVLDV